MTTKWCELVGWVHYNPKLVCKGWKGLVNPIWCDGIDGDDV